MLKFSYTPGTDRGRVRRAIGDAKEDAGPLPDGSNFTDAEIDQFISDEGTWQRAVAAAFEALAAAWANEYTFTSDGATINKGDRGDKFLALAATWRKRYGGLATVTSGAWKRVDGYSDDTTSDEADTSAEFVSSSEYVAKITRQ